MLSIGCLIYEKGWKINSQIKFDQSNMSLVKGDQATYGEMKADILLDGPAVIIFIDFYLWFSSK